MIGKLGKLAPVHRPGALMLAAYLPATKEPIPESVDDYSCAKRLGMMMNDHLGDCTCAAVGHLVQVWTAKNGNETVLSDDVIVGAYSAITGYSPDAPGSDQGAVEADVLDYWTNHGFGGHKLTAHAVIETSSEYQMKLATFLFGGVYTGLALPISAQNQAVWTAVHGRSGEAGSWGGHAVPIVGYDAHRYTCITWGAPKAMTAGFWHRYGDEAYAPLSRDWVDQKSEQAPNLLKWDALKADLESNFRRAA